ncbi:MAG TPA: trypsin-like peptidase domain-containing protein [Candidatus Paceibacterota bacterium]|nr:trypsin-like peptidase domain-containing protein [Candidatus Paceibacterota bacterium]
MTLGSLISVFVSFILSLLGGLIPFPAHESGSPAVATSTPAIAISTSTLPQAASTTVKAAPKKKPPVASKPLPSSTPIPSAPAQVSVPVTTIPIEELHQKAGKALVNIFCTTKRDGSLKPITASGILISPDGVILTNAHAAQYYLLRNYREPGFIDCIVRAGSPAAPKYRASLLYLSPPWIAENKAMITAEKQLGTGENDFALLLITGTTDGSPLPATFPYVPLAFEDSDIMDHPNADYLLAGYPAGFLGGNAIVSDLYQTSTVGRIKQVYTFRDDTADLLSFGGSLLAQRGASGGAAISEIGGKVSGIIVTTSEAAATGDRDLHIVTGGHIHRSFRQDTGRSLSDFLKSDLYSELRDFSSNVAPGLTLQLVNELQK